MSLGSFRFVFTRSRVPVVLPEGADESVAAEEETGRADEEEKERQ